jgi:predicted ABC-type ATPase
MKPKLIVIAGPNGSGKTSLTSELLKHEWIENCIYINPDTIAQEKFGNWNDKDAVLKAAQYAAEVRENCLQNNESLIFETVLSVIDKVDFIEKAIQLGYFVRLFFVGTDHPSINASRIARRVMEGGHDVPISKIISRYYKSIINCSLLSKTVDRLYVYDNSAEYENPKLLFRTKNGVLEKFYTTSNSWSKPILDML